MSVARQRKAQNVEISIEVETAATQAQLRAMIRNLDQGSHLVAVDVDGIEIPVEVIQVGFNTHGKRRGKAKGGAR